MAFTFEDGGGSATAQQPGTPNVIQSGGYDWILDVDEYGDTYYRSLGRTASGGGGSSVDHFYDISPTDQYGMDSDKRDFDYGAGRDVIKDARDQRDFDYNASRDKIGDDYRNRSLQADIDSRRASDATDRARIAQQAAAAAADTQARLAGVQQAAEEARLQHQVGMAGAANDAERNRIQASWNAVQAQLAREENALRDRLTTQQNQIAQYDAETKRAGTMGQLALDNNKFILEKSTSPRDLFGLFMMQRGINPDWDAMAAGRDPGHIDPLVAQPLGGGFQFSTPAVQFGQQAAPAQGAGGGGGGGSPQPQPEQSITPPGLQLTPPSGQVDTFNPWANQPAGAAPPVATPPPTPDSWLDNGGYEMTGRDYARDPVNGSSPDTGAGITYDELGQASGYGPPTQRQMDVDYGDQNMQRYPTGGFATDSVFMAGDSPKPNPNADGARPEVVYNPTRAPLFVAPHPKTQQELGVSTAGIDSVNPWGGKPVFQPQRQPQSLFNPPLLPQQEYSAGGHLVPPGATVMATAAALQPMVDRVNPATRPVAQVYDFAAAQDRDSGWQPAMKDMYYRQRMMADYGQRGWTNPSIYKRPMPQSRAQQDIYRQERPRDMRWHDSGYAQPPLGARRAGGLARGFLSPDSPYAGYSNTAPIRRFAIGTQAAYEAAGMGSQYLPTSSNPGVDPANLPPRLRMLADAGMPLSPALIAGATGGRAPTLNLGGAVTAGRGAGVLPSLQTLGQQSKSETEHTRGYFEGVGGVPWADIVDFLGKSTSSLRSAAVSRAA